MRLIRLILNHHYFPLIIFATAMGFLEAIVVVYIREIYYPAGFRFPLINFPSRFIGIEWIREISTLFMLGSVAWISGKFLLKRLSVFLFIFGIWDIVYYVGLKIFIDWPESFFTWDILFLIPITWVSPVLAPILCSLLMITMALFFDFRLSNNNLKTLEFRELVLMLSGALVIFFTLTDNKDFLNLLTTWEPVYYHWGLFTGGIGLICTSLFIINKRSTRSNRL